MFFSGEYCEIFKNTYFEENLRTATSALGCLLLNYSLYIALGIKLTLSGVLSIFHPKEFTLKMFYLFEIKIQIEIYFKCDCQ